MSITKRAFGTLPLLAVVGALGTACGPAKPPVSVAPAPPGLGCPVGAGVTLVTACDLHGWELDADPPATAAFVTGPSSAPEGLGSIEFALGADGRAELHTNNLAGMALADITELSYWTYVVSGAGEAPVLTLVVDNDGNGTPDATLDCVPASGDVVAGGWQLWNALPLVTAHLGTHPNATIVNPPSGGGVRLSAGFGWSAGFVGNVDAVTINTTTFDFDVQ